MVNYKNKEDIEQIISTLNSLEKKISQIPEEDMDQLAFDLGRIVEIVHHINQTLLDFNSNHSK